MKNILITAAICAGISAFAQNDQYNVASFHDSGRKAPEVNYQGEAWLNFLTRSDSTFDYNVTQATFKAHSTLNWHKHETDQVLIVVEGKGYYQERGKEPMIIHQGDVIRCPKEVEHFHTSSLEEDVSYIAVYGSAPTVWTEVLTMDEYERIGKQLEEKK